MCVRGQPRILAIRLSGAAKYKLRERNIAKQIKMDFQFHPVDSDRWSDLERLFESKGGPHYCWCMAWRKNELKQSHPGKAGKKASMKRRVDDALPIGLLAYAENEPVAWCSIGPRESFRSLGGDKALSNVWSLVCFFVTRRFRKQGMTSRLIGAAVDFARQNGADHLEAYPVDPESPSYRFMGINPVFEKAGFVHTGKAGSRRNVMRLDLRQSR